MAAPARAVSLQAYVLHSHEWSESSLIVELLTRERGRLAVVAKGARRPYSQLRAVLNPFQRIAITLARTPPDEASDLFNLRQAEWLGGHAPLSGSALFAGFYLNELLIKSLARLDPHPVLFDAYAATLPALSSPEDQRAQAALRAFELLLLRLIGVLPDLSRVTATQQPLTAGGAYALHPEQGVVSASSGAADESFGIDGALLCALEASLAEVQVGQIQAACLQAPGPLRQGLRHLLHHHLGTAQMRTRQVFLGVQRLLETQPRLQR